MAQVSINDIEQPLRTAFGSFGLDHIELESGFDHDGEPAVFVTAVLPQHTPPMPGHISASANVAVAGVMQRVGDHRLSYLYIRRPDDERPEDERARASSQ